MSTAPVLRRAVVVLVAVAALVAPALAGAADPPRYRAYYDLFDRGPASSRATTRAWSPRG